MSKVIPITVAHGDGIGPEIMDAVLSVISQAHAQITIETIQVGEEIYRKGNSSGIPESAWESINRTHLLLKSPITTPQGGGYKSLNVTMRKTLGLFANVRPCLSYHPFITTLHPKLDVVIVRENEEDLYAGIEYRQTHDMYQTLKLISRTGSERIIRYAFEYAVQNNRKKVSCFSKDNIMKFTDGIFHKIFDEVAKEYPNIVSDHHILDIGTARLAAKPEIFDVIVTSNLYGDVISDVVAEISGSVGLAGSANIGPNHAIFEAIHGSAPDIAGKDMANPSGLLQAAVMMLVHIGQAKVATTIQNALLITLEQGIHTADIYNSATSTKKVGTKEFAKAVIANLGKKPKDLKSVHYQDSGSSGKSFVPTINIKEKKQLVGVDVFIDWDKADISELAERVELNTNDTVLALQYIAAKGLKIFPANNPSTIITDHYCLRFVPRNKEKTCQHQDIIALLSKLDELNLDFVKTEHLYSFDDKIGFSLAQGE